MRESIGTTFLLNFIVVFIVFVFAFLAATLSYYKAYKINNAIIHAMEKYEGYNKLSYNEIQNKLKSYGYETEGIKCSNNRFVNIKVNNRTTKKDANASGKLVNTENYKKDGYCIYIYFNENPELNKDGKDYATTDIYYSFGAVTYMRIKLPVIGGLIKLPVFSKTYNIYYFPKWDQSKVVSELINEVKNY